MKQQLAVIFDMDGVLVDSYRSHLASWRQLCLEHDFELTEAQFAQTFGQTSREIIAQFFGHGLSEATIAEMDDRKEALYRRIVAEDFPAMHGAVQLIDALHDHGFKLAVGSSGPRANVELAIRHLNRTERFAAVVTGQDVARGKPDPEVFTLGAARLGVDPRFCAVIEDSPPGVEAANAARTLSIALLTSNPAQRLTHAHQIVAGLTDLTPRRIESWIMQRNEA